jgi:hypothetical protein
MSRLLVCAGDHALVCAGDHAKLHCRGVGGDLDGQGRRTKAAQINKRIAYELVLHPTADGEQKHFAPLKGSHIC